MNQLPKWVLANPFPATHDFESLTVLDQTARLYGAMTALIAEYNVFADQLNSEIEKFVESGETEISNFKKTVEERIRCKFNDIDARIAEIKTGIIKEVDEKIEASISQHIKDDLERVVSEKIATGELSVSLSYDQDTESLNLNIGGEA